MRLRWPWREDIQNRSDTAVFLTRWRLLPINRWFNVHLHRWNEPDDTTFGLHDHPYDFLAVTLLGRGQEMVPVPLPHAGLRHWWRALRRFRFYRATDTHAIVEVDGLWTLVVHFRRRRTWGFWRDGRFTTHTEVGR